MRRYLLSRLTSAVVLAALTVGLLVAPVATAQAAPVPGTAPTQVTAAPPEGYRVTCSAAQKKKHWYIYWWCFANFH